MGSMQERIAKARDKAKRKREQTTQEFRDEMHEKITKEELMELISDVDWVLQHDQEEKDEYALLVESFYGKTSLAGVTDYTDHRDDTVEELKALVMEQLEDRQMQKGNYYDKDGNPFDTVILKGTAGGWSSYCHFSETGKSFFEWMRS